MKQEVRQIRKVAMDEVKQLKGKLPEDESRKLMKEVSCLGDYLYDVTRLCSDGMNYVNYHDLYTLQSDSCDCLR